MRVIMADKGAAKDPSWTWKRSSEFEQKQLELLQVPQPRISWEEYKEKHKDQLNERMGMGEKEQANYRRMLDDERKRKVNVILSTRCLDQALDQVFTTCAAACTGAWR